MAALPAYAQASDDAQLTDAERIARMRDQANQQAQLQQPDPDQFIDPAAGEGAAAGDAALPQYANDALPLGASEGGLLEEAGTQTSSSALGGNWMLSTLAALGVVIGLVYGIRWLLRRGGVGTKAAPQGSVVEVLSRTTVAPRSHVLLMRIGSRILIVNDSTAGMRTLATVEDPEEVADLLGALDASKANSLSQNFSGVMKKLSGQWSGAEDQSMEVDPDAEVQDGVGLDRARGVVTSVRSRLAALSGSGGKA